MLLNLFAPRPPLRWVEPTDHAPEKRCTPKIGGIAQYMDALREYKDNDGYVPTDSWLQKRDRKKLEKKEKQEKLITEGVKNCTSGRADEFFIIATLTLIQTNPPKIQRYRATPLKHSSCLVYPTVLPLTISSASLVATVLLSVSASSKTSRSQKTRHPRSASAVMPSLCSSVRRT